MNGTKKPSKPKANGEVVDQNRPSTEEEKPPRSAGAPITLVVDRTVDGPSGEQDRDVEMTGQ